MDIPSINLEEIKEKQIKQQIRQMNELTCETIEKNLLAIMANENALSLSCVQLDNDFITQTYKNDDKLNWVSEEEKQKSFDNEIIWAIFYGEQNYHASSIFAIMEKLLKL